MRSLSAVANQPLGRRSLARLVFALDERLRHRNGVFDYVPHPDCVFRAKIDAVAEPISLPDGVRLRPGDRIIELHMRNEHFPRMDARGPTIGWALRITKLMDRSFRELAEFLDERPEFDDIAGVRAVMLRSAGQIEQFERVMARFGFSPGPNPPPRGLRSRARNLGEKIFTLMLILAGNPKAACPDVLWHRGVSAFLSRQALEERYRERLAGATSGRRL